MPTADTIIRARIDVSTKERAQRVLEEMGLNPSVAIRMFLTRIAAEGKLPFAIEVPVRATRQAIDELESGKGTRFATVDALFADGLNDQDD